jgi:nucleoside-diphosphate-sugar epimerase
LRAERHLLDEAHRRGLNFLIYRFGTICGVSPGMRFHTAVNRFCWQAAVGQPLTVWSTALHQRRPYLDLHDAVNAILFALSRDELGNSVQNVVTDNLTVFDITEAIRKTVPELQIQLVDSKIMNEFSFDVGSRRIQDLGYSYEGSVTGAIEETLKLLSGVIRTPDFHVPAGHVAYLNVAS